MRPALIALTLLVSNAAFAQTTKSNGPTQAEIRLYHKLYSCPVDLSASLHSPGRTMWTISEEDLRKNRPPNPDGYGSGVHIDLRPTNDAVIKQVSLRVFFPESVLHYQPVAPSSTSSPDQPRAPRELAKNFQLVADGGASVHLSGELLVNQYAGITRVAVLSIDYADGTSWHAKSSYVCSAEPSHFMPVGAK
jgi:hypothetical protein